MEMKNGKVSFKQKPMSLEKMTETMQGAWRRLSVWAGECGSSSTFTVS